MAHDNGSKFSNPGPAGLMVLGFYLIALWAIATGMAPHELGMVLVPLGLAGAIIQLTAGVIALHKGDILLGNVMCAFSGFMWLGCGENLLKALQMLPANTMAIDGWIFLLMGILMAFFTQPHLAAPKVSFWFFIFTSVFFIGAGLFFLTKIRILWLVASWDLLLGVIAIVWLSAGIVLNTFWGKPVIPLGKPYRSVQ